VRRLSLQLILGLGVALMPPSLAAANPIGDENDLAANSGLGADPGGHSEHRRLHLEDERRAR
jgi:hypothetical protein